MEIRLANYDVKQEVTDKYSLRGRVFHKLRDDILSGKYKEYEELKALALKSAKDFLTLYEAFPDKDRAAYPARQTFYGAVPRTAREMYEHTRSVNAYYFTEIGVSADNNDSILDCRRRGFAALEAMPGYLENCVLEGSYGEFWSLRKLLRRFIWHDRIHAKAMYRLSLRLYGEGIVPNIFGFENS